MVNHNTAIITQPYNYFLGFLEFSIGQFLLGHWQKTDTLSILVKIIQENYQNCPRHYNCFSSKYKKI
jgi:hypothetical protein